MELWEEMMDLSGMETDVDIVFVVDATASMRPIWNMLEESVTFFSERIKEYAEESSMRKIGRIRIKVVWFKDFYYCADVAYGESLFFEMQAEKEKLKDYMVNVNISSSGHEAKSALEALSMAMRSDFTQGGTFRRHFIVLFTDAPAHPFEDYNAFSSQQGKNGCRVTMYPDHMPQNLKEFIDIWNLYENLESQKALGLDEFTTKLDMTGRRLVLVAPETYPWDKMEYEMDRLVRMDLNSGNGCGLNMDEVCKVISFTI